MTPAPTELTTILLVDDHPLFRKGVRSVLEQYDNIYVVGEASNGLEAVLYARTLRPDVIVMDVVMPDMDGVQATRLIKHDFPDITVIGLSVNESRAIREALLQAGASTYLQKENVGDDLYHAISHYLR